MDVLGVYQCTYSVSGHSMTCTPDDPSHPYFAGSNYVAGNDLSASCPTGGCQNNPAAENVDYHGPLPEGTWLIGSQGDFPGAASPNARSLTPVNVPNLGDRSARCNEIQRMHRAVRGKRKSLSVRRAIQG